MEPSQPTAFRHVTVLLHEAAEMLAPAPGRLIVDCTLGGGGHSELLCEMGATVLGLDKDPAALAAASLRLERFGERFTAVHADFRDLEEVLHDRGISEVHGVLVDLGVSSPQLDDAARGFSFSSPGPLDMRMDPTQGQALEPWLAAVSERDLAHIIRRYGEEPQASRIARAILRAFQAGELSDTRALAEVVSSAIPRAKWPRNIHPATRTFQALRIALNDELGALDAWLAALPKVLAAGGRAAAISFHSLEDRAVKRAFASLASGCICPPDLPICGCARLARWQILSRKAVVASPEEVESNPRSRSARLRGIERIFREGDEASSSEGEGRPSSGPGSKKNSNSLRKNQASRAKIDLQARALSALDLGYRSEPTLKARTDGAESPLGALKTPPDAPQTRPDAAKPPPKPPLAASRTPLDTAIVTPFSMPGARP